MTLIDGKTDICWQLDDLNEPFNFEPDTFDLIHSRMVCAGINASRWPTYIRDLKRYVSTDSRKFETL